MDEDNMAALTYTQDGQTVRSVRFWHYGPDGQPIKIRLTEGKQIYWSRGGVADEGWHRDSYIWGFYGDWVYEHHCSDGRDCDGRLTTHYHSRCHVNALNKGVMDADNPGVVYPAWQRDKDERDEVYDEYAQAANY
jgi:hypothetical protein